MTDKMPETIWAYDTTRSGKGIWYDQDITGEHTKPGEVVKYIRSDLARERKG